MIHRRVLHPDRKQSSLMFRVKIKESLFYVCAHEINICISLFANSASFFFYTLGGCLRVFSVHEIKVRGAEERGSQLNLCFISLNSELSLRDSHIQDIT